MVDIMSTYGSTSFTSKCPGAIQWRTLSDGKIEVDGMGVPYADDGGYHGDGAVIRKVWDQYKDFILRASERSGIPARWILALIIIESRGVNHGVNSAGAGGMMGMMLQATSVGLKKVGIDRPATKADVADPEMNILAGAGFMRHQADTFGWELPIIAVSHNAGSPKCSPTTRCKSTIDGAWTFDGTNFPNSMGMVEDCTTFKGVVRGSAYALRAVKVNNSAVQMGIGGGGPWLSEGVMLAAAGVAFVSAMIWVFPDQFNEGIDTIFGKWLLLLYFPFVSSYHVGMQGYDKFRHIAQESQVSEAEAAAFLDSPAFQMALRGFLASRAERAANGRAGAIVHMVQEVDTSSYPLKDENGEYLRYNCPLCSTKAKVRRLKRVVGPRSKAEAKQLPIPGEEV